MSCETWNELLAFGDELLRDGSPERRSAESHFAQCRSCSSRAFLLDPSWAGTEATETFDAEEIRDLKRKVLAEGRIREIEDLVQTGWRLPRAAAAVVAAAALAALVGGAAWLRAPAAPGMSAESGSAIVDVCG